jgi:hypothetical protein
MSISFSAFVENYQLKLSTIKLKLVENMKNSDFTWYRPIHDTNLTRLMQDMNRELFIVMDNPNFKREAPLKLNDKMYKLFTFQSEQISRKNYSAFYTNEGFDPNGEFHVDYNFNYEEKKFNDFIPFSTKAIQ